MSGVEEALALLEENPLPATVRATVAVDVPGARLSALAAEAGTANGVDDVVVERDWLQRLAAIREVVARLYWSLAGVLGLGAMLISAAAVRLAVEARLLEVQVLALVGAGRRYLRRPFLYLGLMYGLGGAMLAAMAVSALLLLLEEPLATLFGSYGTDLEIVGFDPMFHVVLLASGAALGVLGALMASWQRLRRMG